MMAAGDDQGVEVLLAYDGERVVDVGKALRRHIASH